MSLIRLGWIYLHAYAKSYFHAKFFWNIVVEVSLGSHTLLPITVNRVAVAFNLVEKSVADGVALAGLQGHVASAAQLKAAATASVASGRTCAHQELH